MPRATPEMKSSSVLLLSIE